jgi:uncharacterized protein YabN with tetrapyrrole methylase and pyrophosphatase domain
MTTGDGSLTVVGLGIRCPTDLSPAARAALEQADDVFHLAFDPLALSTLLEINPDAVPLHRLYDHELLRGDSYAAMVERIMERVRAGRRVCFAIPGHPGVFAEPTHAAIRQARGEGFAAVMVPAVSSLDYLYADLGIDPGEPGSWCFDATDFVVFGRQADATVGLVMLQIDGVGELRKPRGINRHGLRVLTEILLETYPADHEVTAYLAATYAVCDPVIVRLPLEALATANVPRYSTLYVPPARSAAVSPERVARLAAAQRDEAEAVPA